MVTQPLGASVAGELNRHPAGRAVERLAPAAPGHFLNNNLYKYVRYFRLESEMQHNME